MSSSDPTKHIDRIVFTDNGWADYLYWEKEDRHVLEKINLLIRDILRNDAGGIGKPEVLKFGLSGCMSRRINLKDRLVYLTEGNCVIILSCRYHYSR